MVLTDRFSLAAMSLLLLPSAMSFSTIFSFGVRESAFEEASALPSTYEIIMDPVSSVLMYFLPLSRARMATRNSSSSAVLSR